MNKVGMLQGPFHIKSDGEIDSETIVATHKRRYTLQRAALSLDPQWSTGNVLTQPTMSSPEASEEPSTPKKRNAFSELMAPKPKQPKSTASLTTASNPRRIHNRRDGLLDYIQNPTSFPSSRVIYHNADFVVVRD